MAPSFSPHSSYTRTLLLSTLILLASWIFLHPECLPNPQSIIHVFHPPRPPSPSPLCTTSTPNPPSPTFNLTAVLCIAKSRASHSWEHGVLAEALLELHNPELSVFGMHVFPGRSIPRLSSKDVSAIPALAYAAPLISTTEQQPQPILIDGDGSNSDPASLGVSSWLLGQAHPEYRLAASRQLDTLLHSTPRFSNGAISHRARTAEVWGDSVYMVPPFLAYSAVATQNTSLLREAVRQCELHREVLRAGESKAKVASCDGAWRHFVVGLEGGDFGMEGNPGLWSTSNGWAAAGMVRVLATLKQWTNEVYDVWDNGNDRDDEDDEKTSLVNAIVEILDCAVAAPAEVPFGGSGPLLRNHMDDEEWFGEAAGTALLASVAYRMAVLIPELDWTRYTAWADRSRMVVASCVDERTGVIAPVVKWSDWRDKNPWDEASSEAQSFAILMYTAHRDCACAGKCNENEDVHRPSIAI
ncbi:MAG: hypothetical protein Q9160_000823 [Pyrenula sp. 1 TL-2023]